jgi:hypothetical protein
VSFTIINCEQRRPEWFAARAGRLTASVAHCAVAKGKGSAEAVTRRDLRYKLACERITGQPEPDDFLGYDMRRGIEQEPRALAAYEALTGLEMLRTGFIAHDALLIGCSLDGNSDNFERILELKCCKSSLHVRHWHARDEFVREHRQQIAHCLWVTGAKACDLVSFNPYVPPRLRLLCVTVLRQDSRIDEYVDQAERFLVDVESTVREVQALAEAVA